MKPSVLTEEAEQDCELGLALNFLYSLKKAVPIIFQYSSPDNSFTS
jgi:hypothetical protein